jgi:putative acetyltransferase
MISVFIAVSKCDYDIAASLFKAYAASIKINLDFQFFDDELIDLKKMYAMPYGGIILAKEEDEVVGCVAIRKISKNIGELKRMYVKKGHENKGIGKMLLQKALQLAGECNYRVVKLDTLNTMFAAIHLYEQAGFYKTPPYYPNPMDTAVYFEKRL